MSSAVSWGRLGVVLVADDQPMVRRGMVSMLNAQAWVTRVLEADSLAEARQLALTDGPDLVVMETAWPDGHGPGLIRELTAMRPQPVVVVFTSTNDPGVVRAALDAGAHGYLLKKTDPEVVMAALCIAVAGGQIIGPQVEATGTGGPIRRRFSPVDALTPRERHLLSLLANGCSNQEIATVLSIRDKTVRNQVSIISAKLGVASRVQAVLVAHQHGIVNPLSPPPARSPAPPAPRPVPARPTAARAAGLVREPLPAHR